MNERHNQPPPKKGIGTAGLFVFAIIFLGVLYFLQKSGCGVTSTEEKIEWIDR